MWLDVPQGVYHERKQILLTGVRNGKEVAQLQQQIERIKRKSKGKGKRLESGLLLEDFSYADLTAPRKDELSIRLAIDHVPVLIVQCKKITVQALP
ncbi:hypothetical protein [Hymenobacter coccineus]|nr:hypothetical protein [Hymenobacter coccineus]